MEKEIWYFQVILGFIVLVVFKGKRFGTPSWVRSYTTATNYYLGLLAYFLSIGFVYFLLTEITRRAVPVFIHPQWNIFAPFSIVIALLLLLRFGPLSSLEQWFRKRLYDVIGYPGEAYRLTDVLFRSEFERSGQIEKEVTSVLLGRGYDPSQNWLPVADPTRDLWFKAAILFYQIRNWSSNKRYREFLGNARVEFDTLRKHFDQLSLKVSRVFMTFERLGILLSPVTTPGNRPSPLSSPGPATPPEHQEASETVKTTISDLLSDLQEDVVFFSRNVCLFIVRGALSTTFSSSSCCERLRELGFKLETPCPPINIVLLKAFIVFLICLAIPIVVGTETDSKDLFSLFRIVMVATIQVIALATAILPKRHYGFANEDIHGRSPWVFIAGAGLLASVLAALVGLGFRFVVFSFKWEAARNDFFRHWPWHLMAFSTAAVSAFLIQDSRWASASSLRAKRMKDALIMALSMPITMSFVLLIDSSLVENKGMILFIGAVIGFLIGYIVPSAFRDQSSARLLPRQLAGSSKGCPASR